MSDLLYLSQPSRTSVPLKQPRLRRSPKPELVRSVTPSHSAPKSNGSGSNHHGMEILVAIRSNVEGASLENVCIVVGGLPYAPRGTAVIHPGDTSSMIELPPEIAGLKAAVYFELSTGEQHVPLITDDIFDFTPGAVCVLTIDDHTRAHNPPIEIEGAAVRLARGRLAASGE
jgi:hypothetical protein